MVCISSFLVMKIYHSISSLGREVVEFCEY